MKYRSRSEIVRSILQAGQDKGDVQIVSIFRSAERIFENLAGKWSDSLRTKEGNVTE
jgi:predicted transcriptional regulator